MSEREREKRDRFNGSPLVKLRSILSYIDVTLSMWLWLVTTTCKYIYYHIQFLLNQEWTTDNNIPSYTDSSGSTHLGLVHILMMNGDFTFGPLVGRWKT